MKDKMYVVWILAMGIHFALCDTDVRVQFEIVYELKEHLGFNNLLLIDNAKSASSYISQRFDTGTLTALLNYEELFLFLKRGKVYSRTAAIILSDTAQFTQLVLESLESQSLESLVWFVFASNSSALLEVPRHLTCFFFDKLDDSVWEIKERFIMHGRPRNSLLYGSWSLDAGLSLVDDVSYYNRRSDFNGETIPVALYRRDLCKDPLKHVGKAETYYCILLSLWETLEKRLKFRSKYIEVQKPHDSIFSPQKPNELLKDEARVSLGFNYWQTPVPNNMEYVATIDLFKIFAIIRIPGQHIEWENYLKPFSTSIWTAALSWSLLFSGLLTLIYSWQEKFAGGGEDSEYTISKSVFMSFSMILQQGCEEPPRTVSCRLVVLSHYLLIFVLFPAYNAALTSYLTIRQIDLPFYTVEGLYKDRSYSVGTLDNQLFTLLQTSTDPLLNNIFRDKKLYKSQTEADAVSKLCDEKGNAFFFSLSPMFTIAPNYCPLTKIGLHVLQLQITLAVRNKDPNRKILSHFLLQMKESGLIYRLIKFYQPIPKGIYTEPWIVIDLYKVAPLLVFLAVGLLTALLILICEKFLILVLNSNKAKKLFKIRSQHLE